MQPPLEPVAKPHRTQRLLILAGLWLFVALVLVTFRGVLLPFVIAALIAYLVQPLVRRITRVQVRGRFVPRWVAILLIYALFFLAVYVFFVALLPQLYRELARISRDAVAYANSLTPEKVESIAQRAEAWLLSRPNLRPGEEAFENIAGVDVDRPSLFGRLGRRPNDRRR